MPYTSTYTDGDFVIYDLNYAYKSTWLDGRINQRDSNHFNIAEYDIFNQSAKRISSRKGAAFNSATQGQCICYIPLLARSSTYTVDVTVKEDGVFVKRTRAALDVQYYNTLTQAGEGDTFVFVAPNATLLGSLIKKVDKVALSKALNLMSIYERVYNDNGVTLIAGTVVRYNGITSEGVVEIEPTDANQSDNNIVGILQEDIPTGETGACASIKGDGAWVPNAALGSPNDGGQLFISSDTGAVSHTPGAGNQAIGSILHEGVSGGAHYVLFHQDY